MAMAAVYVRVFSARALCDGSLDPFDTNMTTSVSAREAGYNVNTEIMSFF